MKKCLVCGQVRGIKDSHKFCHNCGSDYFEVRKTIITRGGVKINDGTKEALKQAETSDIVDELKAREGVKAYSVCQCQVLDVRVKGPASVLELPYHQGK